ncbi:MAG: hypothetical protein ACTSXQ_00350 [Alphaproteobacteria bacterium]
MTKYYTNTEGKYIGAICGDTKQVLSQGAREVSEPPSDARQKWDFKNKKWLDVDASQYYASFRKREYPSIGEQLDAILKGFHSLSLVGTKLPSDLEKTINAWLSVKAKYPKSWKKSE